VANFPRALFTKLAGAGLFRIPFAAAVGGRGLRYPAAATAVMIEELAYHSISVAAVVDVHCILAGHALEHASPELQMRYLAPLLAGTKVGSFATTEPDASTDLNVKVMQTVATRQGDGYVVNGRKRFITNAPVADFVVLLCVDDGRMTLLVVDLDAPCARVGEPDRKLGNRGQLTADICFDNVSVPSHNVVGAPGGGLRIALQTPTYGHEFARDGVQIFGGYGFMKELVVDHSHYRVAEIDRDCKISEIYEGTNEIQKLVIARAIFGKHVTG